MHKTREIKTPGNWKDVGFHPLAQATKFGDHIDLDGAAKNAKESGYDDDEALIFLDGLLFDGRHRREICKRIGHIPICREYIGDDPVGYALKKLFRQHVPVSERAKVAASIANTPWGANRHTKNLEQSNDCSRKPMTNAEAAKLLNVSESSVVRAKRRQSPPKKPKPGSIKFDWKEWNNVFGALVRTIDKFGNAYNCKESVQAEGLRRLLAQFRVDFKKWAEFKTKTLLPD